MTDLNVADANGPRDVAEAGGYRSLDCGVWAG